MTTNSAKYFLFQYLDQKAALNEKIAEAQTNITEMEATVYEREAPEPEHKRIAYEFAGADKLTYELAHAFVSAVYVYADGRVELDWRFGDVAKQDMLSRQ